MPVYCLKPLSKDEVAKLEPDYEDVVFCPTHVPEQSTADCVFCHARQQQLIERAGSIRNQMVEEIRTRGVQKVFEPLASAKQIPMERWTWPGSKEGETGSKMVSFETSEWRFPTRILHSRGGG